MLHWQGRHCLRCGRGPVDDVNVDDDDDDDEAIGRNEPEMAERIMVTFYAEAMGRIECEEVGPCEPGRAR